MLYHFAPMRKITVSNAPYVSAREALSIITEAIPAESGGARAARVGRRIVAAVSTNLPSSVIQRRLSDAGLDAEVDTIVRFVR